MNETLQANPYVGPRTFTTQEGEFFFGREREARDLLSVVITERLVLFYAQSGAGKSSLINTRLIPGLVEEGEYRILPVGRLLGESVKREDVENIYVYNLITSLIKKKVDSAQLAKLTLSQFLAGLDYDGQDGYFYNADPVVEPATDEGPLKYVLIIDQFEELFTTYPEEWSKRESFLQQLAQAMDDFPNLQFVLTLREDYVALLEPYAHLLPGKFRCRYYMERLGQRGALEAIQGPARKLNRPFVPEVAQKLVNDLSMVQVRQPDDSLEAQPGQYVEPVQLQVVCYSLWDQLPEDCTQITQEHLDRYVGDVDKALGNYFAMRVESIAKEMKLQGRAVSEHEIREWFGKKLITSDGIRNMVAQEKGGKSGGLEDAVVQEFIRKGDLVRAEKHGGATFYELTHDRLVEPILQNNQEWFETKADLLESRASVWLGQGRNASFLLRGKDLRAARKLARKRSLSADERAFLDTSIKTERTRIFVIVGTGLALLIMIFLTVFAVDQTNIAQVQKNIAVTKAAEAENNRVRADQSAMTSEANAILASTQGAIANENERMAKDLTILANAQGSVAKAQIYQNAPGGLFTSTLLAMHAILLSPSRDDPDAAEILRENLTFLPRRVDKDEIKQSGAIDHMAFGSDGQTLFTTGWDGVQSELCGWSLPDRKNLFCLTSSSRIHNLLVSLDGKLMTGDTDGQVSIRDPNTGGILENADFATGTGRKLPLEMDISPDGRKIRIPSVLPNTGHISFTVNDFKKPENDHAFLDTSVVPSVTTFSPSGLYIAAGTAGGTVAFWGLHNGAFDARSDHHGKVNVLRFSPDDRLIISGGTDHYALVTDRMSGERRFRLPNSGSVEHIEVSPDSTWVATASDDRQLRVWDLGTGQEKIRILQDSPITDLKISPKGQLILTMAEDKNVRVWNAETGREVMQIPLDTDEPVLAFNPAEDYLYSADQQGRVSIWDIFTLATPTRSLELNGMAENIQYLPTNQIAFSDQTRVWILPADRFKDLKALPGDQPDFMAMSAMSKLAVSPGLKYLAFLTEDNQVEIVTLANRVYFKFKPEGVIKDMTFTSDGGKVITLDTDGHVQAWEILEDSTPTPLIPADQAATAISAGPGFLAVGIRDKILSIDPLDGRSLAETDAPGDHTLLAFSPDGSQLADASADGGITLWEQKDGKLTPGKPLLKQQAILSLAFSPEHGDWLAVGTAKNVFLIDTASGEEVARIPVADIVNDLSFSSDGKFLTVASSNLIQTWELESMQTIDLVQEACTRIGTNLDAAQWKDVLSPEEYNSILSACGS